MARYVITTDDAQRTRVRMALLRELAVALGRPMPGTRGYTGIAATGAGPNGDALFPPGVGETLRAVEERPLRSGNVAFRVEDADGVEIVLADGRGGSMRVADYVGRTVGGEPVPGAEEVDEADIDKPADEFVTP